MKTQSAKKKGYDLQKLVAQKILGIFPELDAQDVLSTPSSVNGEDIMLSDTARKLFPYSVECKMRATIAVYGWWEQCKKNCGSYTPLMVIRANRKKPLVVMDLDDFLKLCD